MAVTDGATESSATLILLDSGSDEHVAPEWFSRNSKSVAGNGLSLRDVQGHSLNGQGAREVRFAMHDVDGIDIPAQATFQIGHVKSPILSFVKLWRSGFHVGSENGNMFLTHKNRKVPLVVKRN
eukprot:2872951-Amphidinium_carterae.1